MSVSTPARWSRGGAHRHPSCFIARGSVFGWCVHAVVVSRSVCPRRAVLFTCDSFDSDHTCFFLFWCLCFSLRSGGTGAPVCGVRRSQPPARNACGRRSRKRLWGYSPARGCPRTSSGGIGRVAQGLDLPAPHPVQTYGNSLHSPPPTPSCVRPWPCAPCVGRGGEGSPSATKRPATTARGRPSHCAPAGGATARSCGQRPGGRAAGRRQRPVLSRGAIVPCRVRPPATPRAANTVPPLITPSRRGRRPHPCHPQRGGTVRSRRPSRQAEEAARACVVSTSQPPPLPTTVQGGNLPSRFIQRRVRGVAHGAGLSYGPHCSPHPSPPTSLRPSPAGPLPASPIHRRRRRASPHRPPP